ncbi:MAG: transcription elongation factor GreA [Patulibacter sp.]|nr:transcription elongation factor GreA [Patulibacter sp.]
MTAEAQQALQAELEHLETVSRKEIAERIKTAREWGDLKENSEYHDAKNDQAHLETKILLLRDKEKNAQVVEAQVGGDTVGFGSTVVVEDLTSGRENTFTLVSVTEAKPGEGRIASSSPVGVALEGAKVGQTVEVTTPKGARPMKVLSIS